MTPLLPLLLLVPFVAAVVVALLGPRRADAVRWVSLGATVLTLAGAVAVTVQFVDLNHRETTDEKAQTFQPRLAVQCDLLTLRQATADKPPVAIQFFVGVD